MPSRSAAAAGVQRIRIYDRSICSRRASISSSSMNSPRSDRQALDNLRFANDDLRAANPPARQSEIVNRKYDMEMSFSRGLHTGWFGGVNNQQLVHARFGKKRGGFLRFPEPPL